MPAPLDHRPTTVTCLLYNLWARASLMSTGGAKRGCPSLLWRQASKSVYGLCCWQWKVRRKEFPRRQSTRPNFFDMIVWVFTMMGEDGSPSQSVEAPSRLRLPFEMILSWGCSHSLVTVAHITGLWMDGMSQQVPEIKGTTMVDNRRLYAVGTENFRTFEEAIEYTTCFDEEVDNKFTSKKSTVADDRTARPKQGCKERQEFKYVTSEKQVGYQLAQGKQRDREVQNEGARSEAPSLLNRESTW